MANMRPAGRYDRLDELADGLARMRKEDVR